MNWREKDTHALRFMTQHTLCYFGLHCVRPGFGPQCTCVQSSVVVCVYHSKETC